MHEHEIQHSYTILSIYHENSLFLKSFEKYRGSSCKDPEKVGKTGKQNTFFFMFSEKSRKIYLGISIDVYEQIHGNTVLNLTIRTKVITK